MKAVEKYLRSRKLSGPWLIEGECRNDFSGAVVIPALAEKDLFKTLGGLAENPPDVLNEFLVLVVVNNRLDSRAEDKALNAETLKQLKDFRETIEHLNLAWVDAVSPGCELPHKGGGVGMARKIGFDLALEKLGCRASAVLVSLDADTLVRPDYLPALVSHFHDSSRPGGAVIPYCHQPGRTPAEERAIQRYELFLRSYVLGLSLAGSPYAFHTIGSAMACRAKDYARIGGMNCRQAGEDFYFLQQLAKTCGVDEVDGTMVYPSARPSHRVPFGTGRSVSRVLAGELEAVLFYHHECFAVLKDWLDCIRGGWELDGPEIVSRAEKISPDLGTYLIKRNFVGIWTGLKRNHPGREALLKAFHVWFDALKTMKLIHHLSASPFPRMGPENMLQGLFRWADLSPSSTIKEQLAILRSYQIKN
ncbi:MAG: hypothetical protein QGH40_17350 [bacterium]|jgi:hypothetical protein|nr:hypothetical protein [bacterium]